MGATVDDELCALRQFAAYWINFGIAKFWQKILEDNTKVCEKKILTGYNFDWKTYDWFLVMFDNLGCQVRGDKTNKVG